MCLVLGNATTPSEEAFSTGAGNIAGMVTGVHARTSDQRVEQYCKSKGFDSLVASQQNNSVDACKYHIVTR